MRKVTAFVLVWVIGLILLGLYAKNVRAMDMPKVFYGEQVEYIIAYGKPLPERTTFTCIDNRLKKGYHYVRRFNGTHVKCTLQKMTRREYEDLDVISRTF